MTKALTPHEETPPLSGTRPVHISAPDLKEPPGGFDHLPLIHELSTSGYGGWIVLEMLFVQPDPVESALWAARWLQSVYGSDSDRGQ